MTRRICPPPAKFRDGWNIRPELVFELPKPLKTPAAGTVEYTYIAVSAPFKENTWVLAGGNSSDLSSHAHHVIAMVRPNGSKWMAQAQLGAKPSTDQRGLQYGPDGVSETTPPTRSCKRLGWPTIISTVTSGIEN